MKWCGYVHPFPKLFDTKNCPVCNDEMVLYVNTSFSIVHNQRMMDRACNCIDLYRDWLLEERGSSYMFNSIKQGVKDWNDFVEEYNKHVMNEE